MSEPFLSEIRLMSFVTPPTGWALCDGSLLAINANQALFSLLKNTFGGDGNVTFALPDLRGRIPIHVGAGHTLGESGGQQSHTLSIAQIPQHGHVLNGSSAAASTMAPTNTTVLARGQSSNGNPIDYYAGPSNLAAMSADSIGQTGGSQAHPNMQPYLTLSVCIAIEGIFPSTV